MKLKQLFESLLIEKVKPGEHVEINWGSRKLLKTKLKMSDAEVRGTFKLLARPNPGAISVRSNLTQKVYKNLSGDMFNPAHIKNYLDQELHGTRFARR